MDFIRKIIREELSSICDTQETPDKCNNENQLNLLVYSEENGDRNKSLEECIRLIKEVTESGESDDFRLEKINTILFNFKGFGQKPA